MCTIEDASTAWRQWVTPKRLEGKPRHRWYVFPHSFTSDLVHALMGEWALGPLDRLLDPFVGAGTTLLAAKERGVAATGYDLSPLAVFVTRAKMADYDLHSLLTAWKKLLERLDSCDWRTPTKEYPELVRKALPGRLLAAFDSVEHEIAKLHVSECDRDFLRLALLSVIPQFSRAEATGGWLKWVDKQQRASSLIPALAARVQSMLDDLKVPSSAKSSSCSVARADARTLPDADKSYTAVICSPPYPNRHDYTRVFGVELMFGFLDWAKTRELRYQSFHSHPEARPTRPAAYQYWPPSSLVNTVGRIREKSKDSRVPRMIEGYFLDMYLCLREIRRVCSKGARVAMVVGNAQYSGEPVPVDELTAEIGQQAGLACERIAVARWRGNSAQQMGRYGRCPSRESVVVFRRN